MTRWVRLWEDMPTDPKWRVISRKCGVPIPYVISVFNFMMVNAANSPERGELSGWNDEDVAAALDIDEQNVACIRECMQGKVLDGDRLLGWEKRQPQREDGAAERAKTWRERKRTQTNADERPEEKREDTDTKLDSSLRSLSSSDKPDDGDETISVGRKKAEDSELILDVVDVWNSECAIIGLPQVRDITAKRQAAIRARVKDFPTYGFEDPLAGFRALIAKIRGSPFLTGQTSAGFRADFDFATTSSKFHKIMEGSYEAARNSDARSYASR